MGGWVWLISVAGIAPRACAYSLVPFLSSAARAGAGSLRSLELITVDFEVFPVITTAPWPLQTAKLNDLKIR